MGGAEVDGAEMKHDRMHTCSPSESSSFDVSTRIWNEVPFALTADSIFEAVVGEGSN